MIINQPEKITDKDKIVEICRKYFNSKKFLYAVFVESENLIIEGAGVSTIVNDIEKDEVRITLTDSDSNYMSSTGTYKLDDIGYIQEIRNA